MVLGHDIFSTERTQDVKISEDISFDSMLLSPNILKGLKASGFYVPSPIQLHGISMGKCGLDLLLEAKSGTGKTAVFSVVALEKLDLEKGVQTLILAPTREIASQISDVIKTIGAHFKGLSVVVVMGGLPFAEDIEKFKTNVHIVVGSPGRLRHLIAGDHIDLSSVRLMVLDEADKLVEKSFLSDINYIFSKLPNKKQVIMSSATYPEKIKSIISKYFQNPQHVCPDSSSILLGIEQIVTIVPSHVNIVKQTKNRYVILKQILSRKQFKQCLIFCNYQVRVGDVHRMLKNDKWPADKLFGQQEQTDRLEALKILQEYKCRILVTTDLASRGIDASNVDLVVNFEMPHDWQTYLHRIGRAGRYGSYGTAISILNEEEVEKFKRLLRSINIPFELKHLWTREPFKFNKSGDVETNDDRKHEIPDNTMRIKEASTELWKLLSIDMAELNNNCDVPNFKSLYDSFEKTSSPQIENFSDMLKSFENHEVESKETSSYKIVEVNRSIILDNILLDIFESEQSIFLKHKSEIYCNDLNSQNENDNCSKNYNDNENTDKEHDAKKLGMVNGKTYDITNNKSDVCQTDMLNDESGCSSLSESSSVYNDAERALLASNLPIAFAGSKYKEKVKKNKSKRSFQMLKQNTYKDIITSENYESSNNYQINYFDHITHNRKPHETDCISNKINENGNLSENSDSATEYNDLEKALIQESLPSASGNCSKRKSKSKNNRYLNKGSTEYTIGKEQAPKTNKIKHAKTNIKKDHEDCRQSYYNESTGDESDAISHSSVTGKQQFSKNHQIQIDKKHVRYDSDKHVYSNSMGNVYEIEERQILFNQWYQQLHAHMMMIERAVYIEMMST